MKDLQVTVTKTTIRQPLNKPVWQPVRVEQPFCPKCMNMGKRSIMQGILGMGSTNYIVVKYRCNTCKHVLCL